jgi:hypothetical protein
MSGRPCRDTRQYWWMYSRVRADGDTTRHFFQFSQK